MAQVHTAEPENQQVARDLIRLTIMLGEHAKAEELILTGKSISAEEGKAIGLINETFENKGEMEKGSDEWITKNILKKSASSLRHTVKASRTTFNHLLKKMLPAVEEMYLKELMETDDANEGINSFLEKRKPTWKNR